MYIPLKYIKSQPTELQSPVNKSADKHISALLSHSEIEQENFMNKNMTYRQAKTNKISIGKSALGRICISSRQINFISAVWYCQQT